MRYAYQVFKREMANKFEKFKDMNKRAFIKVSLITTAVIFTLTTYITLDFMYLIDGIYERFNSDELDRLELLSIILLKAFLDFSVAISISVKKGEESLKT